MSIKWHCISSQGLGLDLAVEVGRHAAAWNRLSFNVSCCSFALEF